MNQRKILDSAPNARPSRAALVLSVPLLLASLLSPRVSEARASSAPNSEAGSDAREEPAQPVATDAQPDVPSRFDAKSRTFSKGRLAMMLHVGLGTPYGGLGTTLDFLPLPELGIEAGVGVNSEGLEFGITPRLRLWTTRQQFFTLGTGVSTGKYLAEEANGLFAIARILDQMGENRSSSKLWSRAYFWNFEIGYETRSPRSTIVTRPYIGYAQVLNPGDYTCKPQNENSRPCGEGDGDGLLYGGVALGFVF